MVPEGVALGVTGLGTQVGPQLSGLPGPAGTEGQADEAGEDLLGGAALGPAPAHHLGQCHEVGQVRCGGAGGDHLDPALNECQERLQVLEGLALGRRLLGREQPALKGLAQGVGVVGIHLCHGGLQGLGVDADLAGVGDHCLEHLPAQPGHVGVEAGGGGLPHGQEHTGLVLIDLQPLGEGGHVGGNQCRTGLTGQGQAGVGGPQRLLGELTDGLADLEAEGCAGHGAHDGPERPHLLGGLPHLGRHLLNLLLQGAGQGGGDGLGHRGAHVLPHRQRALDPAAAAPGLPLPGRRHELGGGIQPQVGHLEGLTRGLCDRSGHRGVAVAARLLEGQLLAHLPVDRLGGGGGEHLLELGAHRQQLGGTELGDVPHPRHLGDGAGIHPG